MNSAPSLVAHTPGPWRVAPASEYASGLNVDAYSRGYICLAGEPGDAVAQANARLIAAAPELLAQLRNIEHVATKHAEHGSADWAFVRDTTRAAIAKVEERA